METNVVDTRRLGRAARAVLLGAAAAYAVDIPKPAMVEACSNCVHGIISGHGSGWCVGAQGMFAHAVCWTTWVSGSPYGYNTCGATGFCK